MYGESARKCQRSGLISQKSEDLREGFNHNFQAVSAFICAGEIKPNIKRSQAKVNKTVINIKF
jgi:hypothetical protein